MYLELENGEKFYGKSFGFPISVSGEVVFQTGMVGYPESLTDPSYHRQILVLTYPLIGNYGIPNHENDSNGLSVHFESDKIQVSGLIVGEYNPQYSHWKGVKNLGDWLVENKIPAISGIDTRQLTLLIREHGTLKGRFVDQDDSDPPPLIDISQINIVDEVSNQQVCNYPSPNAKELNDDKPTILVLDFGIKNSQIRSLLSRGFNLKVVPWNYDFLPSLEQYDGIFLSNGPGDPTQCTEAIRQLKTVIDQKLPIPIFGICLGHQILSLAVGASTYKMKYGNRGHNIPARLLDSKRCLITSQNHGYAVDVSNLPTDWVPLFTNANDDSNEGLIHQTLPYFSVQFHPEAKAGPGDANFLFDLFKEVIMKPETNVLGSIKTSLIVDPLLEYSSQKLKKVLLLGSGGLSIGQAGEFDYSGSQAIKAFKEEMQTVLINPNIATVQTSVGLADKIYYLPITPEFVKKVIELERPDCLALSFGGQTALNCGIALEKDGTLKKYNIHVLGTPISSIEATENRQIFKEKLGEIHERIAPSQTVYDLERAYEVAKELEYPVLVRSAYALGGLGSGFAENPEELKDLVEPTFAEPNAQVIIDKSLKGWKEVEYEIVRDQYDNCISVCNMENLDPLGVHTGESIVVAPSQTLSDDEYNRLRTVGIKTVRHLGIIGECNIQYAMDPDSDDYFIVEINARLSRSSALASKATGYPLANVAAKVIMGYSLVDLKNSVTKTTTACFEPSMDYCTIKIPRWDLKKFPQVSNKIGSSMKSIGEVMAISRSFEEALQKALRMVDENCLGFDPTHVGNTQEINLDDLANPSYFRIFLIAHLLHTKEMDQAQIHKETKIDYWFLRKFQKIIDMYHILEKQKEDDQKLEEPTLLKAKRRGFSDLQIAKITQSTEIAIRNLRLKHNIRPWFKLIDTVAGEFPCYTNYSYSTYHGNQHDLKPLGGVIVLGSGVYRIGSSVEFDWCSVNCIKEIRKTKKAIMINYNPETVSTDYDEADRLYFDELSFEVVMDIYEFENPDGVVLSMGGQLPNNIAMDLHRQNVKVLGTSPENIDQAENRYKFSRMLDNIEVDQPLWKESTNLDDTKEFCRKVGYPCLVRPSYVLSGAAMTVVHSNDELEKSLTKSAKVSKDYPVVVSKFINDAKEIEVDAVAKDGWVEIIAISEHVENAGVHSGDATLILPAQDLTEKTIKQIRKSVYKISNALKINGPFNIQFIAKDDQILVIECNLRVSRTFPFISKTLDVNFITVATQIILGQKIKLDSSTLARIQKQTTIGSRIGVKVPQFSFNRLQNADMKLGVEMVSTGEVACYGVNHYQAYLKALRSSGFKLPVPHQGKVLVSIGSFRFKEEFKESIQLLTQMFQVCGTYGTTDYYNSQENLGLISHSHDTILEMIKKKEFDLVINISDPNKTRKPFSKSFGYAIRSAAIRFGISLMTEIKTAKLLVKSLTHNWDQYHQVSQEIDCKTSYKSLSIPGLVDLHVHLRDLNEAESGTWKSETTAALNGGVTTVLAMPNTNPPIDNLETLLKYQELAEKDSQVDYFMTILGTPTLANSDHLESEMLEMAKIAVGMKLFLTGSHTKSDQILNNPNDWSKLLSKWPEDRIVFLHVDDIRVLMAFLFMARKYPHHYHLCHLKSKIELEMIQQARADGLQITTEVTPHHLFLDSSNTRWKESVIPNLIPKEDADYLLAHLDQIDCFGSDHAPHVDPKNPGIGSLEWTLKIYATAIHDQKITVDTLIEKMVTNPRKIMRLPPSKSSLEIDLDYTSELPSKMVYSKGQNSAYAGQKVVGFIRRLLVDGRTIIIDENQINQYQPVNLIEEYEAGQVYTSHESIMELEEVTFMDEYIGPKIPTKVPYHYKDVLSVSQFDREQLRLLCLRAQELRDALKTKSPLTLLKGKTVATVFYEPSTRTRLSFEAAAKKMGAEVLPLTPAHSSIQKGESMMDTLKTVETYSDLIVLRSPTEGDLSSMSKILRKPLINAGDGCGEHPTQALLDLFTIREERGSIHNLTITFVGDLKHGRTVHSLVKLLAKYDELRFFYLSDPDLTLPKEIQDEISRINPDLEQVEVTSLKDVLPRTDVLYMTRLQEERLDDRNQEFEFTQITPSILSEAKKNLIIMHPLPRLNEISPAVDSDPRAAYFRQMEYGLYMRMALLELLLKKQ